LSSFYIAPIRNDESVTSGFLHYNSTTKEIVFNSQGGSGGEIIYGSALYVSSIVTNNASISSLTVSTINGLEGSLLPTATTYGDYLYWNGTGWAVGDSNVVIGGGAGQTNQGNYGVAIGYSAGNINQGSNSVSIGYNSGNVNQGIFATAVGYSAGNTQADGAVAVGAAAGNSNQSAYAVAIGYQAGILNQSTNAVAIGVNAGYLNQGSNSIAIGDSAGQTSQLQNTIILNATGVALNSAVSSSLYIAPIRNSTGNTNALTYNIATSEIIYDTTKTFVINHPKDESKYLVHACLEGPEAGVYYRGTGTIADLESSVVVELPDYVDALATDLTVQVTPIYNGAVRVLNASCVSNNKFTVYGDSGDFWWHVYGRRAAVDVEPKKSDVVVHGTGPYRWIA
jgi:hypothetical protein